ncbi:hypothetical protein LR066_03150 [candidate division WOR-3 bacterium]|nr:hypothetical protein [candidate division WOR-3 bacterium]
MLILVKVRGCAKSQFGTAKLVADRDKPYPYIVGTTLVAVRRVIFAQPRKIS